jgi:hypothetical protein
MLPENEQAVERRLRRRLRRLFKRSSGVCVSAEFDFLACELERVLGPIYGAGYRPFVFGGLLRDLSAESATMRPRDIDIVVDCERNDDLVEIFSDSMTRRTRFGGLHISGKVQFDVWALPETWAFKQGFYAPKIRNLPKTTFLNVEAIAAECFVNSRQKRRIYSQGFLEAIAAQRLDVNFEPNPFPALCVVRSILTAAKLDFIIGNRLAEYLIAQSPQYSDRELEEVQQKHYGRIRLSASDIRSWINAIGRQLTSRSPKIVLPGSSRSQGMMWDDEDTFSDGR